MTKPTADPSKPLSNARWELFSQIVAMGSAAGPAYAQAGFNTKTANARDNGASVLLRNPMVRARVDFLQQEMANRLIDATNLTREKVLLLIIEQHERNIGIRPVTHMIRVKNPKKGEPTTHTVTTSEYDPKSASQTAKLLADEFAIGMGASASKGEKATDMAARAGLDSPDVVEDLDNIRGARALVLLTGGKGKKSA